MSKGRRPKNQPASVGRQANDDTPRCGLCGKTENLTRTDCCNQWICDDEDNYVMFSFARNSCHRNHSRYTLCAHHHNEEHPGHWQECEHCRADFQTEMYVYYGTNEYNFEKLKNPPKFEPTHCASCNKVIDLGHDGYMVSGEDYFCDRCANKRMGEEDRADRINSPPKSKARR